MPADYRPPAAESSAKHLHWVANARGCPAATDHQGEADAIAVGAAGVRAPVSVPGTAFTPDRMATIR
jgi:hypothetical protein